MLTCEQCGALYECNRSRVGERKFCSSKCSAESKKKKKGYFECKQCGRSFTPKWHSYDSNGQSQEPRYCSHKCLLEFQKEHATAEEIPCIYCGKKRKVFRSQKANGLGRFCSQRCYHKHNGATYLEDTCAEYLIKIGLVEGVDFIRQHRIAKYRLDFYLPKLSLCLETDGEYWHNTEKAKIKDKIRDAYLSSIGIKTFRMQGTAILKYGFATLLSDILGRKEIV